MRPSGISLQTISRLTKDGEFMDVMEIMAPDLSGIIQAATRNLSARFDFSYSPIYDLATNTLSSALYSNVDGISIPPNKNYYVNHVYGRNNSTGNGYLRAYSFELYAGQNATQDSVRGCIGLVGTYGAATVKAIHGTAMAMSGTATGVLTGVVGEVIPGASTPVGGSYAFQASCGDGTDTAFLINTVNNPNATIGYGMRVFNGVKVNGSVVMYDKIAASVGNFLQMRDAANGLADMWYVSGAGSTYMKVAQAVLQMNNNVRTWEWQAINSPSDYVRLTAGGSGEVVRFKGNQSTEFLGPVVFKNYLTGALPTAATYPNAFATFGASKVPIYCDGTNWRKMSDDTIVT